jgi:hypothetical protein
MGNYIPTEQERALHRIRKPLVEVLKVVAECPRCYLDVSIDWDLARVRDFSVESRLRPCFEHAVAVTQALVLAEQAVTQ